MRIIADANIPALAETFEQHGSVHRVDGRSITRSDLGDAVVLLVRSLTRVGRQLLEDTGIRFVGTATIGTDHLDIPWLESQGISWASAPGCNADAAAQYTLAMMMLACERLGMDFYRHQVGIIGHGNVGRRLHGLLDALGIPVLASDPPLCEAGRPGLVSTKKALNQAIISLHVPLTHKGKHATYRMINGEILGDMPDGALLVNSARGDVVDGGALLPELTRGRLHAALDVWPDEPHLDPELLAATTVASPHVAGYSVDGKLRGTSMIFDAYCRWAGIESKPRARSDDPKLRIDLPQGRDPVSTALKSACSVQQDDQALRTLAALPPPMRAEAFDRLRLEYRPRRDFQAWGFAGGDAASTALLRSLGFKPAQRIAGKQG